MPKQFEVNSDSIKYASRQLQVPLHEKFGDLDWERDIIEWHSDFYLRVIKRSGASFFDAPTDVNIAIRKSLTIVMASIYEASSYQLPPLSAAQWSSMNTILSFMNVRDPIKVLAHRSAELIRSLNPMLLSWWSKSLSRATNSIKEISTIHIGFAYSLVILVVANFTENPCFKLLPDEPEENDFLEIDADELLDAQQSIKKENKSKPITIGEYPVSSIKSDITFDDIGGCYKEKEELLNLVKRLKHPEVVRSWGGTLPKAVLLQGPPGIGKTMLVNAFAGAMGWPFFVAKLSDILSMWINQSARLLRSLIDGLCNQGGVLALNEADALLLQRGSPHAHHEDEKIVNEWNLCMDSIRPEHRAIIFLTTNFSGKMDEAALREGRVDRVIKMRMPNENELLEVLQVHVAKIERSAKRRVFDRSVLSLEAAHALRGLSPAAIAAVLARTVDMRIDLQLSGKQVERICLEDIIEVTKNRSRERDTGSVGSIGFIKR